MIKAETFHSRPERAKAKKHANDMFFFGSIASCIGTIEIMREVFLPHADQNIFLFAAAVVATIWGVGKLVKYR